jgi:hypothetical protein
LPFLEAMQQYRCHSRCGNRSIKQETLENAVLESLFQDILVTDYLEDLQKEVQKQIKDQSKDKNHLVVSLKNEIKDIERQINDLVSLIPQMRHKRPLVEKLDAWEAECIALNEQLEYEKTLSQPPIIDASMDMLKGFIADYRQNLEHGEPHTKKAVIQSVIEKGIFDGERLEIVPGYPQITGVKMASPRGVEPLSPP